MKIPPPAIAYNTTPKKAKPSVKPLVTGPPPVGHWVPPKKKSKKSAAPPAALNLVAPTTPIKKGRK